MSVVAQGVAAQEALHLHLELVIMEQMDLVAAAVGHQEIRLQIVQAATAALA